MEKIKADTRSIVVCTCFSSHITEATSVYFDTQIHRSGWVVSAIIPVPFAMTVNRNVQMKTSI